MGVSHHAWCFKYYYIPINSIKNRVEVKTHHLTSFYVQHLLAQIHKTFLVYLIRNTCCFYLLPLELVVRQGL